MQNNLSPKVPGSLEIFLVRQDRRKSIFPAQLTRDDDHLSMQKTQQKSLKKESKWSRVPEGPAM